MDARRLATWARDVALGPERDSMGNRKGQQDQAKGEVMGIGIGEIGYLNGAESEVVRVVAIETDADGKQWAKYERLVLEGMPSVPLDAIKSRGELDQASADAEWHPEQEAQGQQTQYANSTSGTFQQPGAINPTNQPPTPGPTS